MKNYWRKKRPVMNPAPDNTGSNRAVLKALNFESGVPKPPPPVHPSSLATRVEVAKFPYNVVAPEGSTTIDASRAESVAASSNAIILSYTAPNDSIAIINAYSLSLFTSSSTFPLNAYFIPTIDGNRILSQHGDPQDSFRIKTFGETSANLKDCQITLLPNQVLSWQFFNAEAFVIAANVRILGYLTPADIKLARSFGG